MVNNKNYRDWGSGSISLIFHHLNWNSSKKESYSNILESALNNKTDYFNSIWNRALLHYKILNAVTKKTPFEWSSVFWLKICKDIHRETKVTDIRMTLNDLNATYLTWYWWPYMTVVTPYGLLWLCMTLNVLEWP